MTDIRYYPLIDCDTDGTEKAAMIPTLDRNAVKTQSDMWIEEMIPHHFRLYAKKAQSCADTFEIRCPRCGTVIKRISGAVNENRRSLYVCSACAKI
nr:MAG TPA: DNA glycosylase [Caudoviricetes sp.]